VQPAIGSPGGIESVACRVGSLGGKVAEACPVGSWVVGVPELLWAQADSTKARAIVRNRIRFITHSVLFFRSKFLI